MRLLTIILFFSLASQSFCQFSGVSVKSKKFQTFSNTKTLVVLQNSPKYDSAIIEAVTNHWFITEVQFIKITELAVYQNREGFSFLSPINIEYIKSSESGPYTEANHLLAVFLSDKKNFSKYRLNDMIAYAPLDFKDLETDRYECHYRLNLIIPGLQRTILNIKKFDIKKSKPEKINIELIHLANKKSPLLSKKTLLINEKYIHKGLTEEIIRTQYPYPYLIATTNFIREAIENRDKRYAVLIKAATIDMSIVVQEVENAEVIYLYKTYKKRTKLNKKDFRRLFKAVSKL